MASLFLCRFAQSVRCSSIKSQLKSLLPSIAGVRNMTYYPVDDTISGLSDEQIQVYYISFHSFQYMLLICVIAFFLFQSQLRKTVFDFVQKELAPKAAEIDKANDFPGMRVNYIRPVYC